MNPKIEEVVKSLRGCVLDVALTCDKCVATGEMDCNCRSELMLTAANYIEQLQQELIDERYRHDRLQDFCVAQGEELSRLREEHKWIPVEEPPSKQEPVWIYYKNWAGKWVCNVGWWSGDAWYHRDDTPGPYGWGIVREVPTHWMPLPEPPMEDASENENKNAQG